MASMIFKAQSLGANKPSGSFVEGTFPDHVWHPLQVLPTSKYTPSKAECIPCIIYVLASSLRLPILFYGHPLTFELSR